MPAPGLSEDQVTYLGNAMNGVSRTFALVVPAIEAPLSHHFAVAYLICRVVDNIEDAETTSGWRRARFDEVRLLLDRPSTADEILRGWDGDSWPGLTEAERHLMSSTGGGPLWQIYALIPTPVRARIAQWVREMADGMAAMDTPGNGWRLQPSGVRVLARTADYNAYCYYVAGTVGQMATEMVVHHYGLDAATFRHLEARSEACGRGLQKTNIVKDFAVDLLRGVCYLPDEWLVDVNRTPLALQGAPTAFTFRVLADVLQELRQATEYVLGLPYAARGYRVASLLCLLPAYETLLDAALHHTRLFTDGHRVKISRRVLARCLADARSMAEDNDAVLQYARRAETRVSRALGVSAPAV